MGNEPRIRIQRPEGFTDEQWRELGPLFDALHDLGDKAEPAIRWWRRAYGDLPADDQPRMPREVIERALMFALDFGRPPTTWGLLTYLTAYAIDSDESRRKMDDNERLWLTPDERKWRDEYVAAAGWTRDDTGAWSPPPRREPEPPPEPPMCDRCGNMGGYGRACLACGVVGPGGGTWG